MVDIFFQIWNNLKLQLCLIILEFHKNFQLSVICFVDLCVYVYHNLFQFCGFKSLRNSPNFYRKIAKVRA
jgi:hypothetical protein